MSWLIRDGDVLASVDVARSFASRAWGLLGRRNFDGAMLLPHTSSIHTLGMRFPLDVAFLDRSMIVLGVHRMVPWRLGMPRRHAHFVLEAQAGAFERWGLHVGDHLELRD